MLYQSASRKEMAPFRARSEVAVRGLLKGVAGLRELARGHEALYVSIRVFLSRSKAGDNPSPNLV